MIVDGFRSPTWSLVLDHAYMVACRFADVTHLLPFR
jgi:hypothetical protein